MTMESYSANIWRSSNNNYFLPRSERRNCTIPVRIVVDDHDAHGVTYNLSAGGLGLQVDPIVRLHSGQRVLVEAPQIGALSCTVRWATPPRYGLEFDAASSRSTLVREFYDQLDPQS